MYSAIGTSLVRLNPVYGILYPECNTAFFYERIMMSLCESKLEMSEFAFRCEQVVRSLIMVIRNNLSVIKL